MAGMDLPYAPLFVLMLLGIFLIFLSIRGIGRTGGKVTHYDIRHNKWLDEMRLIDRHREDSTVPADIKDQLKEADKVRGLVQSPEARSEAEAQYKIAKVAYCKAIGEADKAYWNHKRAVAAYEGDINQGTHRALVVAVHKKQEADDNRLRAFIPLREIEDRLGLTDLAKGKVPDRLPE